MATLIQLVLHFGCAWLLAIALPAIGEAIAAQLAEFASALGRVAPAAFVMLIAFGAATGALIYRGGRGGRVGRR